MRSSTSYNIPLLFHEFSIFRFHSSRITQYLLSGSFRYIMLLQIVGFLSHSRQNSLRGHAYSSLCDAFRYYECFLSLMLYLNCVQGRLLKLRTNAFSLLAWTPEVFLLWLQIDPRKVNIGQIHRHAFTVQISQICSLIKGHDNCNTSVILYLPSIFLNKFYFILNIKFKHLHDKMYKGPNRLTVKEKHSPALHSFSTPDADSKDPIGL